MLTLSTQSKRYLQLPVDWYRLNDVKLGLEAALASHNVDVTHITSRLQESNPVAMPNLSLFDHKDLVKTTVTPSHLDARTIFTK